MDISKIRKSIGQFERQYKGDKVYAARCDGLSLLIQGREPYSISVDYRHIQQAKDLVSHIASLSGQSFDSYVTPIPEYKYDEVFFDGVYWRSIEDCNIIADEPNWYRGAVFEMCRPRCDRVPFEDKKVGGKDV